MLDDLVLSLTRALFIYHTHTHTQSLRTTHTLSLSLTHTHTRIHTHTHTHSLSLSLSLSLFLILSPSSISLTHTLIPLHQIGLEDMLDDLVLGDEDEEEAVQPLTLKDAFSRGLVLERARSCYNARPNDAFLCARPPKPRVFGGHAGRLGAGR